MGRRGDYTGVEQTCPTINSVRDWIEGGCDEDTMESTLKELEEIRQMNSDLRDFGNRQAEERDEMEKDRDYYQKRVDELEREVKNLESEVRELEKQLSEA